MKFWLIVILFVVLVVVAVVAVARHRDRPAARSAVRPAPIGAVLAPARRLVPRTQGPATRAEPGPGYVASMQAVGELLAQHRVDEAQVLLREILRAKPGDPRATEVLRRIEDVIESGGLNSGS